MDYVVESNFTAFEDVVNELNGVKVTVKSDKVIQQIKKIQKVKSFFKKEHIRLMGRSARLRKNT